MAFWCYTVSINNKQSEVQMAKYTEDYSKMTDEEVVMTYNAVMANAYAGDECALEDEMEKRGIDADYLDEQRIWANCA